MAYEPLKNSFGPDVAVRIGEMVAAVWEDFDRDRFLEAAVTGFEELELTPRARHISDALALALPRDRAEAMRILVKSLGSESEAVDLTGMASFLYMPHVMFVADHGTEHFDVAMMAQYELTRRFTAEFSIRTYLELFEERTLARLWEWAHDSNVHVRRLVSEGTRPRLPWASRLRSFQEDPAPVLKLLEVLKDDPEEYVRRSVANNLNDIAKDHPGTVIEIAGRWEKDADANRMKLIRHALRTLVKAGDPAALEVLGYAADTPVEVRDVTCTPDEVPIGGKVALRIEVANPSTSDAPALVDFRVHFIKANGQARPKVFKGVEMVVEAGGEVVLRRTVSLRQHTTRKHYPGRHEVDVLVNGVPRPGSAFELKV